MINLGEPERQSPFTDTSWLPILSVPNLAVVINEQIKQEGGRDSPVQIDGHVGP